MRKYITNPLRTEQETEKSDGLETLGGEFDHLVDTCPLRLTSNNAPTNRETLGTAIVGMTNGSYRYRHFDNLSGDAVTAELFGIRRLMSCDSVRRNSITVYTAGKEDAASAFSAIAGFLHKITSASQLKVEQRWQLIIYWAFRKYRLIYRLYPPLLGDQIMLPLT